MKNLQNLKSEDFTLLVCYKKARSQSDRASKVEIEMEMIFYVFTFSTLVPLISGEAEVRDCLGILTSSPPL